MGDGRSGGAILLVEGDPAEAELLSRVLGPGVRIARDGPEALAALGADPPRLVVTADRLPGPGGLDLLGRIRASAALRAVPVVLLTPSPDPELVAEAYRLGVNSVVRKPIAFEDLRAALRQVAAYWLERNV
ncbi:MAG TPA: response regulator [Gemmatimonadales bacterium]|nr:response regulator [Gemmatimonadales bacterium]